MIRITVLTFMLLVSTSALAQDDPAASPAAFAQCAALAQASANQHRDVIKDLDAANNIQAVADGYRAAASISSGKTGNEATVYVNGMVDAQLPRYAAQLDSADDAAAQIFQSDTQACARIEPQAYNLIKQYNDARSGQAN